jgi:hypothetical protein
MGEKLAKKIRAVLGEKGVQEIDAGMRCPYVSCLWTVLIIFQSSLFQRYAQFRSHNVRENVKADSLSTDK